MGKELVHNHSSTLKSTVGRTIIAQNVVARRANKIPYPGYLPLLPITNDLRADQIGPHVHIEARIIGSRGRKPVTDAAVEVWHDSVNSNRIRHRAKLFADNEGYVRFTTDFPFRQKGKNYEIYLRVVVDKEAYYARLTFNHTTLYLKSRKSTGNTSGTTDTEFRHTYLRYDVQLRTAWY